MWLLWLDKFKFHIVCLQVHWVSTQLGNWKELLICVTRGLCISWLALYELAHFPFGLLAHLMYCYLVQLCFGPFTSLALKLYICVRPIVWIVGLQRENTEATVFDRKLWVESFVCYLFYPPSMWYLQAPFLILCSLNQLGNHSKIFVDWADSIGWCLIRFALKLSSIAHIRSPWCIISTTITYFFWTY